MLGLQITAPEYLVIELVVVLLKNLNSLSVGHMTEVRVYYMLQSLDQSLVNELIEECHLFRCILQYIADNVFQHALCQQHIILQISKCHLRLNHPELSCMSGSIGILCTESRSEGVNILKCTCEGLSVQLSTYSQIGRFVKEVFAKINLAILGLRNIIQIHSSYLEHLSGTLTVTSGDQRSVHIYKTSLLEELVDCISNQRTHTEHCLESVCSGT